MQIWRALDDIPPGSGPAVVTLGNFDGVHIGHEAVLATTVGRAREAGLAAVAVTFDPHPVAVLHPDRAPAQLMSLPQRLEQLASTGLDGVLVMEFTPELARWSPRRFVEDVLVRALGARVVVVGRDTRFGERNSGDIDTLRALGEEHGFAVVGLDDVGRGERCSSTRVRGLLEEGRVEEAAERLGRPHRVSGLVVHGLHRGRELGYPTANLSPDSEGMVPADGVYAGWLERPDLARREPGSPDVRLPAAISVGTNPHFDDVTRRTVEAYVLDRTDLDLYGEIVHVDFTHRLRGMASFESLDALLEQMAEDVRQARGLLA